MLVDKYGDVKLPDQLGGCGCGSITKETVLADYNKCRMKYLKLKNMLSGGGGNDCAKKCVDGTLKQVDATDCPWKCPPPCFKKDCTDPKASDFLKALKICPQEQKPVKCPPKPAPKKEMLQCKTIPIML